MIHVGPQLTFYMLKNQSALCLPAKNAIMKCIKAIKEPAPMTGLWLHWFVELSVVGIVRVNNYSKYDRSHIWLEVEMKW